MRPSLLFLFLLIAFGLASIAGAQSMEDTLKDLTSSTIEGRVNAVRHLAKLPPSFKAAEPLIKALRDPALEVRLEALKTWGSIGQKYDGLVEDAERSKKTSSSEESYLGRWQSWQRELIGHLAACVEKGEGNEPREAVRTLALLGESVDSILPPDIITCGTGIELPLSYKADNALAALAKSHADLLFSLVGDKNPQIVYAVVSPLAFRTVYAPLGPILTDFVTSPKREWRAIGLYCRRAFTDTNRYMLPSLADPDDSVRECALFLLYRDDTILDLVAPHYFQAGLPLKRSILRLLYDRRSQNYSEVMLSACRDENPILRRLGFLCLSVQKTVRLPDEYLLQSLRYPDKDVRCCAFSLLSGHIRERHIPYLLSILPDKDGVAVAYAQALLAETKDLSVLERLITVYRQSKETDGHYLSNALQDIGLPAGLLVKRLSANNDWRIRLLAVPAIIRTQGAGASDLLIRLLKDANDEVSATAIWELGQLGGEKAYRALVSLLHDPRDRIREDAICALGEIGDKRAIEELLPLTHDPNHLIFAAASETIEHLQGLSRPKENLSVRP